MRKSLLTKLIPLALTLFLVLASAAQAYNDGRGFYGATNDKVVTDAGFILIVFFPVFIFTMSMLQKALDKRKAARKGRTQGLPGQHQVARRLVAVDPPER
jgi:hypothetical protein